MTITLKTLEDRHPETFETETPEQLVGLLWKTAFIRETSPDQYMVEVARRVKVWNGKTVRSDDAKTFLLDLAAAGFVHIDWK